MCYSIVRKGDTDVQVNKPKSSSVAGSKIDGNVGSNQIRKESLKITRNKKHSSAAKKAAIEHERKDEAKTRRYIPA